jgi:tetratricopeptide (TPR) repeat protein
MDDRYQGNLRKSKWYESYNKVTFMLAGLGCLIPLGLLLTLSGVGLIIGGPFLFVGGLLVILAVFAYAIEIWKNRQTVPFFCPYCDHRQRVKGMSVSYSCRKCGNRVIVRSTDVMNEKLSDNEDVLTLRERVPFARVVLNYNKARKMESEGRLDEALDIYLENIESNEKVSIGHYERAVSILEKKGELKQALQLAETAQTIRYPQRDLREYANRVFSKRVAGLKRKLDETKS